MRASAFNSFCTAGGGWSRRPPGARNGQIWAHVRAGWAFRSVPIGILTLAKQRGGSGAWPAAWPLAEPVFIGRIRHLARWATAGQRLCSYAVQRTPVSTSARLMTLSWRRQRGSGWRPGRASSTCDSMRLRRAGHCRLPRRGWAACSSAGAMPGRCWVRPGRPTAPS